MLVLRRLTVLSALVAPLLAPALVGGSDAPHVRRAADAAVAIAIDQPAPPAGDDGDEHADARVTLRSPGHGAHTAFHPATAPRELLLSFDDGPDLRGTPLILEELDRRGIKAIFFVTGWRLLGRRPEDIARRDLVRKIAAHGHLVANHTMNHHHLCHSDEDQAAEIDGNAELIARTTGVRPILFRSPYGDFCPSLEAALAARELPDIGWNIDPQDWKSENEDAVYSYLTGKLSQLSGRGIMLLHDTHEASVHALPRVLDWLARENARAVRAHREPVRLIDYRAVAPKWPVTESGLPTLVEGLVADAAGPVARLFSTAPAAPAEPRTVAAAVSP
jgi:peptidoglycan/xylan/chitin deacetylase (PgdA/CDA1 family)